MEEFMPIGLFIVLIWMIYILSQPQEPLWHPPKYSAPVSPTVSPKRHPFDQAIIDFLLRWVNKLLPRK